MNGDEPDYCRYTVDGVYGFCWIIQLDLTGVKEANRIMLHYILVLCGIVAVAVCWVLFQIWLNRNHDGPATGAEDALLCQNCEEPCGKQLIR